jgi:hypothetical protein
MNIAYDKFTHWLWLHADSLTIFAGATTGALWKVKLYQVYTDLATMQNFEGAIIVAIRALIGAAVAWMFKSTCNYIKKNRLKKSK